MNLEAGEPSATSTPRPTPVHGHDTGLPPAQCKPRHARVECLAETALPAHRRGTPRPGRHRPALHRCGGPDTLVTSPRTRSSWPGRGGLGRRGGGGLAHGAGVRGTAVGGLVGRHGAATGTRGEARFPHVHRFRQFGHLVRCWACPPKWRRLDAAPQKASTTLALANGRESQRSH